MRTEKYLPAFIKAITITSVIVTILIFAGCDKNSVSLTVLDMNGEVIEASDDYNPFLELVYNECGNILDKDAKGKFIIKSTFNKKAFESCKNAYEKTGSGIEGFAQVVTKTDGQILCVFSKGQNNINHAITKTQPYSSFKPLSVYAPALENGTITWASTFTDSPVKQVADENGQLTDWPANATGTYQHTDVALDECIKHSLNTAAVRCLTQSGVSNSVSFLSEKFGIDVTFEQEQMALNGEEEILHNIALGYLTAGVSPVDIAGYYQIFATGGKYTTPFSIKTITDEKGNIVYKHNSEIKQIISEETAYIMNMLLQHTLTKGGTAEKAFIEGLKISGKTGTGSNYSGNWFIGYTPEYICSIWHGQNSRNICTETFSHLITGLENDNTKDFPACPQVTMKAYCKESGGMLSINCNSMATGYFSADSILDRCKIHNKGE